MEEIPTWARSSGSLADNAYRRTLGEYREPFSKCFVLIIMCVSMYVCTNPLGAVCHTKCVSAHCTTKHES